MPESKEINASVDKLLMDRGRLVKEEDFDNVSNENRNTKEARENRVTDIMSSILQSDNHFAETTQAADYTESYDLAKKINDLYDKK